MKKRLLWILSAVFAAAVIFALCASSFADFGDFGGDADYGGGGGYDYGGNDYGGGGYDYDDDDDDDYGYHNGRYDDDDDDDGHYESETDDEVGWIPFVIVIAALAALIFWGSRDGKRKYSSKGRYRPPKNKVDVGDRSTPDSELRTLSEYSTVDPDFDAAELRGKVSDLYVSMQKCWTKGDISELRPFFTDALFTQFERQLAQKKEKGLTNRVENISVQNVALRGFRQENGVDHMIVRVEARIIDYTVDDSTGKVVSGSKDREKFMTYEWDMSRTSGKRSLKKDGGGRPLCPSCGAPLDLNASARCEYCGSVISSSEHDWAICRISGISQKTL
jgi:hypothetical protein